jgi:D-threo-aldose 1-dehydrogenase
MLTKKILGRTSLSLYPLSFGASRLVGSNEIQATETISAGIKLGMNHIDTAPYYGFGESERLTGFGIQKINTPFYLSTKVGRLVRSDAAGNLVTVFDYSYEGAEKSLSESLFRLQINQIDMAILHDVSHRWHGDQTNDIFDQAMKGAYKALLQWRECGLIKAIGIGINDCAISLRAINEADFDFIMLAGRTTLLDQEGFEKVLPLCLENKIGVIAAAPFNSGILATGPTSTATYFSQKPPIEIIERTEKIQKICLDFNVPMSAAALQLAMMHPAVTSVLAGYQNVQQVQENHQYAGITIPKDFWNELVKKRLLSTMFLQ